jgi:predicted transcriptional regulator
MTPQRAELLTIIQAAPGLTLSQLRERASFGWGSVYHHVGLLTRAGLIRTETSGRRLLVYPRDALDQVSPEASAAMTLEGARADSARQVARALLEAGPMSSAEIAHRTGLPYYTVYRTMTHLLSLGLAQRFGDRRPPRFAATLRLRNLLQPPQNRQVIRP